MKHLISPLDLSVEELDQLLDLAQDIEANPKKYAHACDGKKLATLFYEHPCHFLLCRHLCHASPKRRSTDRCKPVFYYSDHQCR